MIATIFFGSISLIVSFFDQTGAVQIRVALAWARALLAAGGVRVQVEGLEQIDPNGSYVFIANHASYYDTPVALAHIPVQFRFLAKRGLFQLPFLGTHLSRAGHIPVPREDPRASVKTMQAAAEVIQRKKISLLIFPEGGRIKSGEGVAHTGVALLAAYSGAPVLPAYIAGSGAAKRLHKIVVTFGPALHFPKMRKTNREELAEWKDQIMASIRALGDDRADKEG